MVKARANVTDGELKPGVDKGISNTAVDVARATSIQDRATRPDEVGFGVGILSQMVRAGETVPPWWSFSRDMELRRFWKQSDHLSGAMYVTNGKIATMNWKIRPKDRTIGAQTRMAGEAEQLLWETPEFGAGWETFITKWLEDVQGTGNGGFAEIIGAGNPEGPIVGKPVSLAHLDSTRCYRTSNPLYPVIYRDESGRRFKLHYTRVLYASLMPSADSRMNGVGFCLEGGASVMMADGSSRTICDIVSNFSSDPVLSVDGDGKLVPKKVIGWHKNPRLGRELINIRGKKAQMAQGRQRRNSWVTEDHPILTPGGWVHAGELKTGDEIVTGLPMPNRGQMEFLIGTLMGDSSIIVRNNDMDNNRPRYSVGHSIEQVEWFKIKKRVLEHDFGWYDNVSMLKLEYRGEDKFFPSINGGTHSHAGFFDLYTKFYSGGKKAAPIDLLREYASPRMFASWYLDDGYITNRDSGRRRPGARLCTSGFLLEEVVSLCELMNEFGYNASPISARGKPDKRDIRLSASGSEKFFNDIAPYVVPSMRYKIPYGLGNYDEELWSLGAADVLVDKVIVERGYKHKRNHVYCIDVEDTHNFITAGVVVHNCSIDRCLNTAQNLIDIGRYKQEKLGSRPARILLVGKKGITAEEILTAFMRTEEMDDSRGLSRYRSMVAIAPEDRRGEIEFEKIELSGVPDGFDEAQSTTLGMFTIALGFGVDARELWPASVTGASKADAMIQHLKARGRGPGQIMQIIERQINQKFLPPTLEFSFDLQDDEQDALQADVRDKRSIRNERDVKVGTVSVRVVREIMLDAGDLTDSQFEQLELEDGRLEDGTDAISLFFSPDRDIKTLLTVPGLSDPFAFSTPRQPQMDELGNVTDSEKDGAVESIDAAILKANEGLLRASGVAQKRKARQAIAALKRLRKLWTGEATLADDDTYVPPIGATPPGQPGPKPTQTTADAQRIRNEDDYDGENANQVVEDIA